MVVCAGRSAPHGHASSPSLHPELCLVSPKIHAQRLSSSNQELGGFCNELMPFSCLT